MKEDFRFRRASRRTTRGDLDTTVCDDGEDEDHFGGRKMPHKHDLLIDQGNVCLIRMLAEEV